MRLPLATLSLALSVACAHAADICRQHLPELREIDVEHQSACLRVEELGL